MLRRSSKEITRKFHPLGTVHVGAVFHDGCHVSKFWNIWSHAGTWNNNCHHRLVDDFCIPNKMGFYIDGRFGWEVQIEMFRDVDIFTFVGILMVSVIILMLLGIFAIIFPGRTLTLVYASLGALIFCIYLVYDIQLMMGGKHKYSISPEEYIFAALNLYVDIVNIFMYLLMLIGASRS